MLRRTSHDVETLLEDEIGIRLCKGAYKEPSDIAFSDKRDVDKQYEALMERLISSGIYHGIATHDEKLIAKAKEHAFRYGIAKDKFEFQMLYGVRPDLQRKLVEKGYTLRVYIPYGSQWLAYGIRRWKKAARMFLGR